MNVAKTTTTVPCVLDVSKCYGAIADSILDAVSLDPSGKVFEDSKQYADRAIGQAHMLALVMGKPFMEARRIEFQTRTLIQYCMDEARRNTGVLRIDPAKLNHDVRALFEN